MKKFATLLVAMVLTVAGCSASAAIASKNQVAKSTATSTVNEKTTATSTVVIEKKPLTSSELKLLNHASNSKEVRNYARMTLLVKYLKTRVERTSYVFSGSSTRGWDCSGMVRWTYKQFGITLPHSANKQAHLGSRVSNPNVGDIVVFAYNGSTSFYHSGIYIGNGKIINANYGSGTTIIEPLTNYKHSQIRYVRVIRQAS
jgi:cell wall-associated NlpC family hydrolase